MTEPENYGVAADYRDAIAQQEKQLADVMDQKPNVGWDMDFSNPEYQAWLGNVQQREFVIMRLRTSLETYEAG